MTKRIGIYGLCFLLLGQTGCASMTEEQKSGVVGAGVGAAVGALAGGLIDKSNRGRGAAIGALAGGLVGGAAGWAVGAYQVKQVKPREEIATAKGYTPQQGVLTTIEKTAAMPQPVKPGDQLTFQAQYTVLAPAESSQVKVREVRTIFFNNQRLTALPERELMLAQGTNEIQFPLTLPKDAAEGSYLVMTTVEPVAANARSDQATTPFLVGAPVAEPAGGPLATTPATTVTSPAVPVAPPQPAPAPVAVVPPPAPEPPRVPPRVLHVKVASANVRDGAGGGFKVVAKGPRGTALEVLEEGGTADDRWYKVKLDTGQEGWVAASTVGESP